MRQRTRAARFWRRLPIVVTALLFVGCGDNDRAPLVPGPDGLVAMLPIRYAHSIRFSPSVERLAVHVGPSIESYMIGSGRRVFSRQMLESPSESYSPSSLACTHSRAYLAAGALDSIYVVDAIRGEIYRKLGQDGWLSSFRSVAFSPDDRVLYVGDQDSRITVWRWQTGQRDTQIVVPRPYDGSCITLSPDGRILAAGGFAHDTVLLSTTSWESLAVLVGNSSFTNDMEFAPTGKYLATCRGYRSLQLWDMETFTTHWILQGADFGSAAAVSFSPDGHYLATNVTRHNLGIVDVETGEVLKSWASGHESEIFDIRFSPDGRLIAYSSHENLKIWDVETLLADPQPSP